MAYDLLCLSHLRWDFVHQRPQHLMNRAARNRDVFFVEEPLYGPVPVPALTFRKATSGVRVVVPILPERMSPGDASLAQADLLKDLVQQAGLDEYLLWLYTPMATAIMQRLKPAALIYDCMDELSGFKGAPPELAMRESALLHRADLVFTGGPSLHRAKRHLHHNIHCFPSSVDFDHFAAARLPQQDPASQTEIPHPRIGFFGVIDERMDVALLARVAELRPAMHFVMVGPVVKIDPATLPQRPNIHWLGARSYDELPAYIAGWDAAMLPFAHNEATRYISPTKVPEYLAAGRPVVSTAIRDVMHPYGVQGLARIAHGAEGFACALDDALEEPLETSWPAADRLLRRMSWDLTWSAMDQLATEAVARRAAAASATPPFTRTRAPAPGATVAAATEVT